MKRIGICLWMVIKRMGKHPVYWILLLLFPIAVFAVPRFNGAADEKQILVGYVMEEAKDQWAGTGEGRERVYTCQIMNGIEYKLSEGTEDKKGLFQYIKYTERDDLKKDILTGELSGGIVFDEDFIEKLMKQDYWHCITLYLPEGMNVGGMIQEDVFAKVYQAYSAVCYTELLEQHGYHIESEEVLQKFSEYQKEGKVFAVDYEVYGKNSEVLQNTTGGENVNSSILSLRGILAFLTLLSACLGALDGSHDRKGNIGKGMHGQRNLGVITVGAPILIATLFLISGMIFENLHITEVSYMEIKNLSTGLWAFVELSSAMLYGFILWFLAILFSRLLPEKLLEGLMPCFLLMVLICCPIFLNLGENIPLISYLTKLFPVSWYLEFWG